MKGSSRVPAPDSILSAAASLGAKKKSGDGSRHPAPIGRKRPDDSESRAMTMDAARVNAMLVALLMTASAVNGLIFYAYL
jgi:hypothetical protein